MKPIVNHDNIENIVDNKNFFQIPGLVNRNISASHIRMHSHVSDSKVNINGHGDVGCDNPSHSGYEYDPHQEVRHSFDLNDISDGYHHHNSGHYVHRGFGFEHDPQFLNYSEHSGSGEGFNKPKNQTLKFMLNNCNIESMYALGNGRIVSHLIIIDNQSYLSTMRGITVKDINVQNLKINICIFLIRKLGFITSGLKLFIYKIIQFIIFQGSTFMLYMRMNALTICIQNLSWECYQ